ncbi:uncharacterized protein [Neodiprion pinetum]|uniref:Uncharacterized protein LOC107219595 isoform X2 n=1 Tax=Neodiprion lecontei TaxID=441921 RepID=A0ABM3G2R1_NEOLC|nr:uncharacterized protein LOC124217770 isoform X2 [Neodiprion pinetum]XP_046594555.1 uncharacterized protein LOC107219595 isoform X2 [Neodiprion lecontei]
MDNLGNWTNGIINVTTPVPGRNSVSSLSSSEPVDKLLIIAPSLVVVNQDLRWIFLLHTYGFACLFFVLSFYTFFSILNLRSLISSRPFMSTINVFLCLLGASRSGCLFIDPYNLKETMPRVIGSIMWDIGFPCVTSAFCLIQLAFLQLTQLKFGPEKLQKESCLSLIITAHFSCIIASDGVLAFHNHYIAKYVIQTIFLVWSIMLYLTFLHAGYKVMHLLRTVPNSMLTRDNSHMNQKGIMQLAMLAPYNNLATSVAAALVPTLLGPKLRASDDNNVPGSIAKDSEHNQSLKAHPTNIATKNLESNRKDPVASSTALGIQLPPSTQANQPIPAISTVPEVYVRPPTPTPSTANLPIITVSSPSRRSSLASRRGSDISGSSRRNSECSVRFINEEQTSPSTESRRNSEFNIKQPTNSERPRTPESILRRHSENITPASSTKDLRRCSDFTHEKNRSSQFATKLRRNSDFGNRTPKRLLLTEEQRLPSVLDHSPTGSRRNSDIGSLMTTTKLDSRRNSEFSCRRNSEFFQIKPLIINRRSSDISIRTLDKSPTHYNSIVPENPELQEKSESDSDQPDCNEKAALMNNKLTHNKCNEKDEITKTRKKNLSWKNDKYKDDPEEITAESSLLPDNATTEGRITGADFTLHSILNHIAYVNRAKSDTPLHIPEADTAAARKLQIRKVLNVTYATAILGIILCVADIGRIFGPYAETATFGTRHNPAQIPQPWPWLLYQTLCRALELIMGCAMASITKQPSVSPRHQYLNTYPSYSLRMKQRENLYI